ncbi:MAG: uncharacterized protein JWQ09_430 [Segetibacter sp.]|nr:uncharacterized protein [Segetibacter sp.]
MLEPQKYFEHDELKVAYAIEDGNVNEIKRLIKSGIDVNVVGKDGMTFLFFALGKKKKTAMITLLSLGADPNKPMINTDGSVHITALAAGAEDSDFLKILLEHGANPDGRENDEPAMWNVILSKNWNNMDLLIRYGVNLNLIDKNGRTAIYKLATYNQYEKVAFLLDKGADYSIADKTGGTVALEVQETKLNPESPYFKWQQIVKQKLIAKGVKFPVKRPWEKIQ